MKKTEYKKRSFFNKHPWLPGVLTLAYVLSGVLIPLLVIYIPTIGKVMPRFFSIVSFILIAGPILLTILQILNFRHAITSIRGLAMLYLEIVLMFGVIYFYAVSANSDMQLENHDAQNKILPVIRGIDTDWIYLVKTNQLENRQEVLKNMLICFHDSIHFSLITSTTVGYGDMTPATPVAKILVDIQVLVSFFLISFGVAFFFSQHKGSSHSNELKHLNARIKILEMEAEKEKKRDSESA
jgi:hypothetical protein